MLVRLAFILFIHSLFGCAAGQSGAGLQVAEDVSEAGAFPDWITEPSRVFASPVGAACAPTEGDGYEQVLRARRKAKELARVYLFQILGGTERIAATEKVGVQGSGSDFVNTYEIQVKSQTSGRVGRTEIVREEALTVNGSLHQCVALGLS